MKTYVITEADFLAACKRSDDGLPEPTGLADQLRREAQINRCADVIAASKPSAEQLAQLASDIIKSLKERRVHRWTTWDSFAGRQVHHEKCISEEDAVIEILQRHFHQMQSVVPPI